MMHLHVTNRPKPLSHIARLAVFLILLFGLFSAGSSNAFTAKEIDASVNAALDRFHKEVKGSREFLNIAKGVLVLPRVWKAGFVFGGEYGEGALIVGGKTAAYYSIASGSFGFQLGVQKKDIILVFLQEAALKKFRASSGWKAGVDGSVAFVAVGVGESLDTTKTKEPIIGFMFGQKGLMYNLTLEGSKITKLTK